MPLSLSPVVIGLAFLLAYGSRGWLGPALGSLGLRVVFDVPGMILATMFVSLPFVVREVEPVLRELGVEQEEAAAVFGASALQTFWHVTLPNIAHAISYGVVLTVARSVGEFGAVSGVSGHLVGRTQTLTQYVADRYLAFDLTGAYAAATLLGLAAMLTLFGMNLLTQMRVPQRGPKYEDALTPEGTQWWRPTSPVWLRIASPPEDAQARQRDASRRGGPQARGDVYPRGVPLRKTPGGETCSLSGFRWGECGSA